MLWEVGCILLNGIVWRRCVSSTRQTAMHGFSLRGECQTCRLNMLVCPSLSVLAIGLPTWMGRHLIGSYNIYMKACIDPWNYSSHATCEVSYKEHIDAKSLCSYVSWNYRQTNDLMLASKSRDQTGRSVRSCKYNSNCSSPQTIYRFSVCSV
jgi:hypothetical protein